VSDIYASLVASGWTKLPHKVSADFHVLVTTLKNLLFTSFDQQHDVVENHKSFILACINVSPETDIQKHISGMNSFFILSSKYK